MGFREWGLKHKLLKWASEMNRPFTVGEAIDRFGEGYTMETIACALSRLAGYGLLKRVRKGVYVITEKGGDAINGGA